MSMTTPDLNGAAAALEIADSVIATAIARLTELGGPDEQQVFAYELAHAGAGIATARGMLDYGSKGDIEASLTCGFAADAIHDLACKLIGREELWGVDLAAMEGAHDFVGAYRDPEFLASLAAGDVVGHHWDEPRPWSPRVIPSVT